MRQPDRQLYILFVLGVLIVVELIFSPLAQMIDPGPRPTITPTPHDLFIFEVSKGYVNYHCENQEVVGIRVHIAAAPRTGHFGVDVSINGHRAGIGLGHLTYYMGSAWVPASYYENDEAIVIEIDPLNEYAESDETNNRMVIPMDEFNAMPLYKNPSC